MRRSARNRVSPGWIVGLTAAAAILVGLITALGATWTCDDAFISFRYAAHLLEGQGLVFNPGERVEGYTNFLWTLWSAVGLGLGLAPEGWATAWGLVFFLASLILLALNHARLRGRFGLTGYTFFTLPLAAILGAFCRDWQIWATGGLETSLFVFLLVAGYWTLVKKSSSWLVGAVFLLAALTRPDGILLGVIAGGYLLVRRGWRSFWPFATVTGVLGGCFLLWKLSYYGDLFPNPYYAKSAYASYFSQGILYGKLFFQRYWVLLTWLPLGVVAWALGKKKEGHTRRSGSTAAGAFSFPWDELLLPVTFALVYTFYIVRVGGGFMYARLLIPTVPFYLIAVEVLVLWVFRQPGWAQAAAVVVLGLGAVATPPAFDGMRGPRGIFDEWYYYTPARQAEGRWKGVTLRRYFEGLPVRGAIYGAEARMTYYSRLPVAIESTTGLTDRVIARQKIRGRSRPGHEKKAPVDYLLKARGVHLIFNPFIKDFLGFEERVPVLPVDFDGVEAYAVGWDPLLFAEFSRRGAHIPDFPKFLDEYIADIEQKPTEKVERDYVLFGNFYFDRVNDPGRRRPFEERLGLRSAAGDDSTR